MNLAYELANSVGVSAEGSANFCDPSNSTACPFLDTTNWCTIIGTAPNRTQYCLNIPRLRPKGFDVSANQVPGTGASAQRSTPSTPQFFN